MNWAQFTDPVSHMRLAGAVVVFRFLTKKVAGSSPFNDNFFLLLNSLNSLKTFRKTPLTVPVKVEKLEYRSSLFV